MADSNVPTYPDMFPASELVNKYSSMNSANFPMYNYYGIPTDAMGRPISSYQVPAAPVPAQTPGVSLNTTPAVNYSSPWTVTPRNTVDGGGRGTYTGNEVTPTRQYSQPVQSAQPTQQAIPSSGFNYLTALANPDKVVTPGVAAPPRSSQPGPIDIDALIANLKASSAALPTQAQTGIVQGTAPSNGFLQTLAALRAGSPGAK